MLGLLDPLDHEHIEAAGERPQSVTS